MPLLSCVGILTSQAMTRQKRYQTMENPLATTADEGSSGASVSTPQTPTVRDVHMCSLTLLDLLVAPDSLPPFLCLFFFLYSFFFFFNPVPLAPSSTCTFLLCQ